MPQRTLSTMAASGRQASRINKKQWAVIPNPATIPISLPQKIKKVVILSLNDTYYPSGFGLWGQKALDIINADTDVDTIFVKVFAGDYLFVNKYSMIFNGHDMLLASNACKFDIGCLGNHEFDGGEDTLKELMSMSSFPLVCSNTSLETAKRLNYYTHYSFTKDNINFGVIGYTTPQTSSLSLGAKNISFYDLDYLFNTHRLFLQNSDIRILLYHDEIPIIENYLETYPEKKTLIDVICTGHRHIIYVNNISRKDFNIPIIQMGSDAQGLGKVELFFDMVSKRCVNSTANILNIDAKAQQLPEIVVLNNWVQQISAPIFKNKIGIVKDYELNGVSTVIRNNETNLGDLVADSFLHSGITIITDVSKNNIFAITNSGNIRNNSIIPINTEISVETVYTILPFSGLVVGIEAIGITAANTLLNYIANVSFSRKGAGAWLQISKNMEFNYITKTYTLKNVSMSETDKFYCILPKFLADGNDGYTDLKKYTQLSIDIPTQNSLITYINFMNGIISYPNTATRIII
jgi:2',3'-cyclic-nucleotide 2'-phosphodiesterase (5'-nucleotidase family)